MNKKGFTLIELLVVIAILSILSLIAVPAVVKSYNNSVIANMHIQENNVADGAKLYIEDYCNNRINGNECPKLYKDEKIVCLSTLQEKKYLQKVYYKKIECDGAIQFTLTDTGKYKESKTYLNCGLNHEYQTDPDFDYLKAYDCYRKYMSIKYSIVYYGNGSTSGSTSTSKHEYGMEKELTANGFKKQGYSFFGWSMSPSGEVLYSNKQKVKNLSSTNGSKIDLYAKWTTNGYTIAYDANGGDGTTISSTHTYDIAQNLSPNGYTKLGYTFQGWSTTESGNAKYTDKQSVVNLAEEQGEVVTLYAVWKANTYTIAYNRNGSTVGNILSSTHQYDESKTLTLNTYIKTGNEFIGWSTTPTGIVEYTDGQEVTNLSNEEGKEVILYAVWKPYTVTITYNANGGSHTGTNTAFTINGSIIYKNASPLITTINHGETISTSGLADPDNPSYLYLTKSGNITLEGKEWCTKADGTGTCYSDAINTYTSSDFCSTNTSDCSAVLYANWTSCTYTITYNGNGSTSGSMTTSSYIVGESKALTANVFKKDGYTFLGWNISSTASTAQYTNKQVVSNLSTTCGANVTLYAVWKENTVTITYNANGGSHTGTNTAFTVNSSVIYKNGSPFVTTLYDSESTGIDGLADPDNPSYIYLTRNSYTLVSGKEWCTKSDGTGTCYSKTYTYFGMDFCDSSASSCSVTLYANWKLCTYKILFMPNTGLITNDMFEATFGVGESKALPANTFTRAGYIFAGWSTSRAATTPQYTDGQVVRNLSSTCDGAVTLYAVWISNTYNVIYEKNNGTGTMDSSTFTVGVSKALSINTYTRLGYTFQGWSTSSTATTPTYTNGQTVKDLTTGGSTIRLYAIWKANSYSIAYNGNGATSGSMSNSSHVYGTVKSLTTNSYVKTGYTFLGWSITNTATTPQYTDGQNVLDLSSTNGSTVTLYAVWKVNNRTVVYNSNGGSSCDPKTVTIGSTYGTLCAPTKSMYMFDGWYSNSALTTPVASSSIVPTGSGDITLYAKWRTRRIEDDYTKYVMTDTSYAWRITSSCKDRDESGCDINYCNSIGLIGANKPIYFIKEDYRTNKNLYLDVYIKYSDLNTSGAGADHAECNSRGVTHTCDQWYAPPEYKIYSDGLYVRARMVTFCCSSCGNKDISNYPSGISSSVCY